MYCTWRHAEGGGVGGRQGLQRCFEVAQVGGGVNSMKGHVGQSLHPLPHAPPPLLCMHCQEGGKGEGGG